MAASRACDIRFYNKEAFERRRDFNEKIIWKTPALSTPFNKAAVHETCNFIEKRLQHRCFPVNFEKFLRTTFLKNIFDGLLLSLLGFTLYHIETLQSLSKKGEK